LDRRRRCRPALARRLHLARATHHAPLSKAPMSIRELTAIPWPSRDSLALSPDGKYLAYSDNAGLAHQTVGDWRTRTLPLPARRHRPGLPGFRRLGFPTEPRLLTNLEVAGEPSSIWILSLIGYAPRKFRDDSFAHSISPDGERSFLPQRARDWQRRKASTPGIWRPDNLDGGGKRTGSAKRLAQGDEATGFMQVVFVS